MVGNPSIARKLGEDLGLVFKDLNEKELVMFSRSFERQFTVPFVSRTLSELYLKHADELLLGAMVAKEQFDLELGGERPAAGKFGMGVIRAGYFGWDDWDEIGSITGGSPQSWISSAATHLGGSSANAIAIDENAAHCVMALASLHPAPRIESIQFTIDGKQKPVTTTWWQWALRADDNLKIKELDVSMIWKEDATVLAKVFCRTTGNDIPCLLGASYLPEAQLRIHDPVNIAAAAQKVLRTT